jgi:hypothetical protein
MQIIICFGGIFLMEKNEFVSINLSNKQSKGGNKMNKLFKKITVSVVAFGFAIGAFSTSAFAEDTGKSVDSAITGGSLSMGQPTIDDYFTAVTLNGEEQSTTASLGAFTVTDARGTGSGWNVVVKATQFTDVSTGLTLPENSLDIAVPTVTAQDGASALSTLTIINNIESIDNATGVKILSAAVNGGMGKYDVAANTLTLNLQPKDVKAGTYTSTITVKVTTGP